MPVQNLRKNAYTEPLLRKIALTKSVTPWFVGWIDWSYSLAHSLLVYEPRWLHRVKFES